MKLADVAALALSGLRHQKLRSWLTILGIVIAVASIVTLISLANGVNAQVNSRLNRLGSDIITITPGFNQATRAGGGGGFSFAFIGGGGGGGPPGGEFGGGFGNLNRQAKDLTFSEATDLSRIDGVAAIDARISGREKSTFKGMNATLQLTGVDPAAFNEMNTASLLDGRLLNPNDRYSALLGYRVAQNTFAGQDLLNRQIVIGNYSFRVVGILNQSSGSSVTSDNAVYIPIDTAKIVLNQTQSADHFIVKAAANRNPDDVATSLQNALLELHRVSADNPDFTITTASFFQSTVSAITGTLSLFLGGIAAISLLVGAIGVANTMFMSVLERTKEIGVLKALGMKDNEVTVLFLVEAAAIGFAGGFIGILLALATGQILTFFSIPTAATPDLLAGSLLFSAIIGIVSGAIPARQAAKLQPVEALRYE